MSVVAAVDCGTNSTRLLVSDGATALERLMRITRLGAGVNATGRLAGDAIERTVAVLDEYRTVIDEHGVERVRVTATSAARDAENATVFFDAVEHLLGVRPELLSGTEEAALSFAGATAEFDPTDGPFLVVDIGGGSTEFAVGTSTVDESMSVDMGCVRMTEQYLEHDPPWAEELSNAVQVARLNLDDVVMGLPGIASVQTVVGLAGTVSAVASVEQGLVTYDRDAVHHFRLTRAAVEDVFRTLATEALADRVHNPGLEPERADVIVGGCCILVALYRHLGLDEIVVSESDILDGLVMSML